MSYALRLLMQDILTAAHGYAEDKVRPFTIGGKLNRGTPNAVGSIPTAGGGTGHDRGAEPPLGNPTSDHALLVSAAGGRAWWHLAAGAGATLTYDEAAHTVTIAAGTAGLIESLYWDDAPLMWGGDGVSWGA